jgi:SAM-dependent methyltransferase
MDTRARLNLPQVTLVAVDTRAPELAYQSLQRSQRGTHFARTLLFTSGWKPLEHTSGIELIEIDPLANAQQYSEWVLHELPDHVHTSHVLVTQWDGFVVDPSAWSDEFLQYDYVGAVWAKTQNAGQVGNGGFSLRSQRLLEAARDERIQATHPEDVSLCSTYRGMLEHEHQVRFAPAEVARRFAFENERPSQSTFGFHGPYNLPRFVDEATLLRWLMTLPEDFFRGRDARRMARALLLQRMGTAARYLIERRVQAGRQEPHTRMLGVIAGLMKRRAPDVQAVSGVPGVHKVVPPTQVAKTRHLDLGCGAVPRNPYRHDELYGVDLAGGAAGGAIRRANLALQPIPFADNFFDSVSAYDFIEHIPRILTTADGNNTRFPFIELMDEIWRVLKPGGRLYASTPVFPAPAVFQDPTHVNVITTETHVYFTQPHLWARMYGFGGTFALLRQQLYSATPDTVFIEPPRDRKEAKRSEQRIKRGEYTHVLWEFGAVKTRRPT